MSIAVESKDAVTALTEEIGALKHQIAELHARIRSRDKSIERFKEQIQYLNNLNASKTMTIECQAGELLERVYDFPPANQEDLTGLEVSGD